MIWSQKGIKMNWMPMVLVLSACDSLANHFHISLFLICNACAVCTTHTCPSDTTPAALALAEHTSFTLHIRNRSITRGSEMSCAHRTKRVHTFQIIKYKYIFTFTLLAITLNVWIVCCAFEKFKNAIFKLLNFCFCLFEWIHVRKKSVDDGIVNRCQIFKTFMTE